MMKVVFLLSDCLVLEMHCKEQGACLIDTENPAPRMAVNQTSSLLSLLYIKKMPIKMNAIDKINRNIKLEQFEISLLYPCHKSLKCGSIMMPLESEMYFITGFVDRNKYCLTLSEHFDLAPLV